MTKIIREDGLIVMEIDGKYGIVSKNNQIDLFGLYDSISNMDRGFVEVVKDSKVGLVDRDGKIVLDCIYDGISEFDENGLLRIILNRKEGLYSVQRGWIMAPQYTAIYPAYHNIYVACKNGIRNNYPQIYTLNSETYKMGQEYKYDDNDCNFMLQSICSKGKYGIIDSEGIPLLDFVYDKILFFNQGYAPIKKDNKWGIINSYGIFVVPMEYDRIREIFSKSFLVQRGNSIYELNNEGEIINKYSELSFPQFDNGMEDVNWEKCFQQRNLDYANFGGYLNLIKEECSLSSMYEDIEL